MIFTDMNALVRRLVLAGLPLAGVACNDGRARPVASHASAALSADCHRRVVRYQPGTLAEGPGIGFDRADPRFSDLYERCLETGEYCLRLCSEILEHTRPPGYQGAGFWGCTLACDAQGNPVASIAWSGATPGRRPEGFAGQVALGPGTPASEFFTACAALEAASITAFERLASELRRHGAPEALVRRARRARADEARHFTLMRRLARRFGATSVAAPSIEAAPPRPFEAMVAENATEGCVAETFSAAVAAWQAEASNDEAVRATHATIAADEITHAQLAWDVDAWAQPRLSRAGRQRIAHQRAAAANSLREAAGRPVEPALVRTAGLPAAPDALRLAAGIHAALWSAA